MFQPKRLEFDRRKDSGALRGGGGSGEESIRGLPRVRGYGEPKSGGPQTASLSSPAWTQGWCGDTRAHSWVPSSAEKLCCVFSSLTSSHCAKGQRSRAWGQGHGGGWGHLHSGSEALHQARCPVPAPVLADHGAINRLPWTTRPGALHPSTTASATWQPLLEDEPQQESRPPEKNRKRARHTAARPSRPGLLGHQFHQPLVAGAQQKGQGELHSLPLPPAPSAWPFPSPHTVIRPSSSSQHPSTPTLERKPSLPSHGLFNPPRPTQNSHSPRPFCWATLPST